MEGRICESETAKVGELEASESSKSKSRLRRCRKRKSLEKESMKIKKKQQQKKQKQKKQKKKKQISTISQPDSEAQVQTSEEEEEASLQLPHFPESYFIDRFFMHYTLVKIVPIGRRRTFVVPGTLIHVSHGTEAQKSCFPWNNYAKFSVDEYNKSNQANLEFVKILNVNKRVDRGFVFFLRFVAKDLNIGYIGVYRASVLLLQLPLHLLYFKSEELEWKGSC